MMIVQFLYKIKWATLGCLLMTALVHAADPGVLPVLTKESALKLLQKNGHLWQQIGTLLVDADGKAQEAKSALMPQLGFFAREFGARVNPLQYGFVNLDMSTVVAGTYGVSLKMALIDLASWARLNAAQKNQELTAAMTEQYRTDLMALMLLQYLTVQKTKKSLEAIDAAIERDHQVIEFAEKRIQMGAGVELDLNRAKGLLARDEYKKIDLRASLLKSCQDLALTLGQETFECQLPALRMKQLPKELVESKEALSIERRSDVQASHATTLAAEYLKKFAERESLPKLQLFGEVGSSGVGGQVFGVGGPVSGIAGVQVVFPIFDGGLNGGKAQVEGVKATQASLQEQRLQLDAKAQIQLSLAQLKDSKEVVELSQRNIDLAQEELRFAKEKLHLGSATGLELSNAQANLANAHDMNIQAVFAYELAKVGFFKASGDLRKYFELEAKGD